MRIDAFDWDEGNEWKPLAHGVVLDEVEEIFFNNPHIRRGREARYLAYGVTEDGRQLLVVFVYVSATVIRPVTARPMSEPERRLFMRHRG